MARDDERKSHEIESVRLEEPSRTSASKRETAERNKRLRAFRDRALKAIRANDERAFGEL
jgi:hypothetical protein